MAALNFPSAPVDGEVFSAPNGIVYRWDEAAGLWLVWGTGINNAIISPTPPVDPTSGQLWFHAALGQLFIWFVDETSSQWVPASATAALLNPPGLIADFGGLLAPIGWYLCDGAEKDRIEDAPLFAAIGTLHGEGDGETTFLLPDLRGRVTAMADHGSGRLPTLIDIIGAVGGAAGHTLSEYEMPYHNHTINDPTHAHYDHGHQHSAPGGRVAYISSGPESVYSYADGSTILPYVGVGAANIAAGYSGVWNSPAGAGWSHNNTQPTMAVNKIIKR